LAFVGYPPMLRPETGIVNVSVCFTWDKVEGERLAQAWGQYYEKVNLGGPAYGDGIEDFVPGRYVKEGVTFTTKGCNKRCPWCLVPPREGRLRLLGIKPGYIIQDNNLLQSPREHLLKVFAMLKQQKKAAIFSGGLDATLIDDWVANEFKSLRIHEVFLAADTVGSLLPLSRAIEKLSFLRRGQLRCYVLLAFNGETITDAIERLEAVWGIGCLPFAQLYQPPDRRIEYSREWKSLARTWSRPAAMAAAHTPK